MQRYDLTPINDELKKAIQGTENTLEKEVDNLIAKFSAYQDEVVKISNISALTDHELEKLRQAVDHFTKAFELIKQVLESGGSAEEKLAMLKKVVE